MERCAENKKLSAAVAQAIQRSYQAKQKLDSAKATKINTDSFSVALTQARTEERQAIKALDAHKKEHGW